MRRGLWRGCLSECSGGARSLLFSTWRSSWPLGSIGEGKVVKGGGVLVRGTCFVDRSPEAVGTGEVVRLEHGVRPVL